MSHQMQFSKRSKFQGFTLIELMVGLVVGLLSSLAITQIMLTAEGVKRTVTTGAQSQTNGLLAITTLRQNIEMAGYGFSTEVSSLGCPLVTKYDGAAVTGFPEFLVPVVITSGGQKPADTIRILSSTKSSFSVPIRIIPPSYTPGVSLTFPVTSVRGVADNDLMIAVVDAASDCEVFQVTAGPTGAEVDRATNSWNPIAYPTQAYVDGNYLLNMGRFNDITYTVGGGQLQANTFTLSTTFEPSYTGAVTITDNVVNMKAYYGKDTDADGTVETWDLTTPTTNAGWAQVKAIRVAVVTRSDQFERTTKIGGEDNFVTNANLLWDVGADSTIIGAVTCGASKCVTVYIDHLTDWKNYRYQLTDTIIPLRNMIWSS